MPPLEDTLPSSIPDSPEALHRYLTFQFDSLRGRGLILTAPYRIPLLGQDSKLAIVAIVRLAPLVGFPATDHTSVPCGISGMPSVMFFSGRAAVADDLFLPPMPSPLTFGEIPVPILQGALPD